MCRMVPWHVRSASGRGWVRARHRAGGRDGGGNVNLQGRFVNRPVTKPFAKGPTNGDDTGRFANRPYSRR
jgi:hypothetical protein